MHSKCAIPEFLSKHAKNLLQAMFNANPDKRPTATQILAHPWMTEEDIAAGNPIKQPVFKKIEAGWGKVRDKKMRKGRMNSDVPVREGVKSFIDEDVVLCIVRNWVKKI